MLLCKVAADEFRECGQPTISLRPFAQLENIGLPYRLLFTVIEARETVTGLLLEIKIRPLSVDLRQWDLRRRSGNHTDLKDVQRHPLRHMTPS
ncbi:hypothetical protein CR51_22870 [Caballeronia megalochromosomata]|nr:hypothetical protein CR51_22870 [Caballeronia megalochromosomata]